MALFFATHQCNDVCRYMGLKPFPLAPSQRQRITHHELGGLCPPSLRRESTLLPPTVGAATITARRAKMKSKPRPQHHNKVRRGTTIGANATSPQLSGRTGGGRGGGGGVPSSPPRFALDEASVTDYGTLAAAAEDWAEAGQEDILNVGEGELAMVNQHPKQGSGLSVAETMKPRMVTDGDGDGGAHVAMAKLHNLGEFSNGDPDPAASIYHLHAAARAGSAVAQWALAQLYAGYENDLLPVRPDKPVNPDTAPPPFPVEEDSEKVVRLLEAVSRQIREPMLQLAALMRLVQVFSTGTEGGEGEGDPKRALDAAEKAYDRWVEITVGKPQRKLSSDGPPPPCKLPDLESLPMQGHELMAAAAELVGRCPGGRHPSGDEGRIAREWYELAAEEAMTGEPVKALKYQQLAEASPTR